MSYRTLKRFLGESSLERKCRLAFGLVLLLLIGGSFYLYGSLTQQQFRKQMRNDGRLVTENLLGMRHFKEFEQSHDFKASIETLFENVNGELVLPGQRPEYQEVFDRFQQGEDDFVATVPGKANYLYFGAVRAKPNCVTCHQMGRIWPPAAKAEGELMAISVIPFDAGSATLNTAIFISCAIGTAAVAMLLAYFIVRYVILKPLKHLKDVSDQISRGNLSLRSEIRTGDEFEELSRAFNRMLRSLVDMQQELRRVNADLDGKVDQLAQANMALFESNRLKSDFLATVSHELRTPLNSILGFSDVLSSSDELTNKQRRWIQNIQSSGKMLLAMINDFLDLAKIESGKMELHLDEFSLPDLVEGVVAMMRPLAEKKNIDLNQQIDSQMPLLRQDARKVQQILENLLSNAVKFTPEGGRVQITAETARDLVRLRVADTGVGIAEADRAHIFEKFRQGTVTRSDHDWAAREYPGTGLGLSIVKELCRLLDGEVSVESELGKGSTFTVRLPVHLDDKPPLEMPLSAQGVDLAKGRLIDERLFSARQAG